MSFGEFKFLKIAKYPYFAHFWRAIFAILNNFVQSKFQHWSKLHFRNWTISYLGYCRVGNTEINKMMHQVVFRQTTKKSTMVTKQNREFSLSPIIAAKQKLLTFYVVVFQDCNLVMLRLLQNCILKEFVFNRSRFFPFFLPPDDDVPLGIFWNVCKNLYFSF